MAGALQAVRGGGWLWQIPLSVLFIQAARFCTDLRDSVLALKQLVLLGKARSVAGSRAEAASIWKGRSGCLSQEKVRTSCGGLGWLPSLYAIFSRLGRREGHAWSYVLTPLASQPWLSYWAQSTNVCG